MLIELLMSQILSGTAEMEYTILTGVCKWSDTCEAKKVFDGVPANGSDSEEEEEDDLLYADEVYGHDEV